MENVNCSRDEIDLVSWGMRVVGCRLSGLFGLVETRIFEDASFHRWTEAPVLLEGKAWNRAVGEIQACWADRYAPTPTLDQLTAEIRHAAALRQAGLTEEVPPVGSCLVSPGGLLRLAPDAIEHLGAEAGSPVVAIANDDGTILLCGSRFLDEDVEPDEE